MASELCEGLYFAGVVLDVDARTGGYNLQIAWATAQAAVRALYPPAFPRWGGGEVALQGRMRGGLTAAAR